MSGFWYINMLAGTANLGAKGLYRQTIVGGNYALLDLQAGFVPRADYWVAWAWQRLVSTRYDWGF